MSKKRNRLIILAVICFASFLTYSKTVCSFYGNGEDVVYNIHVRLNKKIIIKLEQPVYKVLYNSLNLKVYERSNHIIVVPIRKNINCLIHIFTQDNSVFIFRLKEISNLKKVETIEDLFIVKKI